MVAVMEEVQPIVGLLEGGRAAGKGGLVVIGLESGVVEIIDAHEAPMKVNESGKAVLVARRNDAFVFHRL